MDVRQSDDNDWRAAALAHGIALVLVAATPFLSWRGNEIRIWLATPLAEATPDPRATVSPIFRAAALRIQHYAHADEGTQQLASAVTLVVASSLFLAACAGESTAPKASNTTTSVEAQSMFVPLSLEHGARWRRRRHLFRDVRPDAQPGVLPSDRIISAFLPTRSVIWRRPGYGPTYWKRAVVSPQTQPRHAHRDDQERVEHAILPCRSSRPCGFNPTKTVQLYMYAPSRLRDGPEELADVLLPGSGLVHQTNHSPTPRSRPYIDYAKQRSVPACVKHFSGYGPSPRTRTAGSISGGQ